MKWLFKKPRLRWSPRAEMFPPDRIVRRTPELEDLENNVHFRMCMAIRQYELPSRIWVFPVMMSLFIVMPDWNRILTPEWNPSYRGLDGEFNQYFFEAVGLLFYLGFLFFVMALPFVFNVISHWVFPDDPIRCADYIMSGIAPETIVRALMGMDLQRSRQASLAGMVIAGLVLPWISIAINPSYVIWVTRCIICFIACFFIGRVLYPEGIAARRAMSHAEGVGRTVWMRSHPFEYYSATWLTLLKAVVVWSVLLTAGIVGLIFAGGALWEMHDSQANPKLWIWIAGDLCAGGVLTAWGIWRARRFMARKEEMCAKAEEWVEKTYEWKREEIFERGSGK